MSSFTWSFTINREKFKPENLQECKQLWEDEILREHPQKTTLLNWIEEVKNEEFLSSFTGSKFQGIKLHSYYPHEQISPNYVPPEFEDFMEETIQQRISIRSLKEWEKVRKPHEKCKIKRETLVCTLITRLLVQL